MEEPIQFSVGQTAQSLTCSIMEKPQTGLDDCLNMNAAVMLQKKYVCLSGVAMTVMPVGMGRAVKTCT